MHKGYISTLCREKEYGSIRTEDGENVHFHKQCLWGVQFTELSEGQRVEFEIQSAHKGYLAFHIRFGVSK